MRSKNCLLAFWVTFFLLQFISVPASFAQFDHSGSFYLGVGYNKALWFSKSTIHVEQGEVGNSYNMVKVKGTNNTGTAIGPTQLNYRLGYYFNYMQTMGIEISYDPINYAIANQNVLIKGTYNSKLNQTLSIPFSSGGTSYYELTGMNLFMVNLVRRYQVYRNNAKSLRVDIMTKGGVGPAFPHYKNRFGVNPVESGQLTWSGWDAGLEAGVRVTGYRYGYLELAGKYTYVALNGMKVYNGTAEQKIHGFEIVATLGGALPITRLNPLFTKEKRIVTILPFFQHKSEIGRKLRKKKIVTKEGDSLAVNGLTEIPEFDEITNRNYRRNHPMVPVPEDSIENNIFLAVDSAGNFVSGDSTIVANYAEDHLSKKELRKRKKDEKRKKRNSVQEVKTKEPEAPPVNPDSVSAQPGEVKEPEVKAPEVTNPPAEVTTPPAGAEAPPAAEPEKKEEVKAPELSKKERKRKEKEEREARERKEKEEREARERKEKEDREAAERAEKEKAAAATPEPEKKEEVKPEETKAPEMSKKERKRKEKEEREERKRKEKEESEKKKEEPKAPEPQP